MAIVVGFVPTNEGRAALTRAVEEAQLRDTDLVVVLSGRGDEHGRESDAFVSETTARLTAAGRSVETVGLTHDNDPAEDLLAVARRDDAELIVIGLRRRSPVGKLILGSNAQRILLDAHCPVLAVKA